MEISRNTGQRFELLRMRPHDHMGWAFAGPGEFAALASPFLAEGTALGERLMYVSEDPALQPLGGLEGFVEPDALVVASIAEVYGPTGIVDAPRQLATFATALAEALSDGFTGIRVAADNTSLVLDQERLDAWVRWEIVADKFMSENNVTGLCAFDQYRVDIDKLRHLATLHPLSSATSPAPQFRLFADAGDLCFEGEMDSFAVTQLWLALDSFPPQTSVFVDLATTTLMSRAVIAGLRQLCDAGILVTIRGERSLLGQFRDSMAADGIGDHLVLQEI